MLQFTVNCTKISNNVLDCSLPVIKYSFLELIASYTVLLLSLSGFILNSIAFYIFLLRISIGSSKFLRLLRVYTCNCVLINLNDIILMILTLTATGTVYSYKTVQHSSSFIFIFFYIFIYKTIWSLTFTFSSLLDLAIVYERILLYLPSLKFLRKTSVSNISFGILVCAIAINLPIFLSRNLEQYEFKFNENLTATVYIDTFKEYKYQGIFLVAYYTSLILRDLIQLVLDICFNIALMIMVFNHYKMKSSLSKNNQRTSVSNKTLLNNTLIAFIICLFSDIIPLLPSSLNLSRNFYFKTSLFTGSLSGLKHSLNFFFLLKF